MPRVLQISISLPLRVLSCQGGGLFPGCVVKKPCPPPLKCQWYSAIKINSMNSDLPTSGSTRRSFVKNSVVAALAASSMGIFSGLVNGSTIHGTYHAEETCITPTQEGVYIDPFEINNSQDCWYHAKCNGKDAIRNVFRCPDYSADPDLWTWCQNLDVRTIPAGWIECVLTSDPL